MPKQTPAPKADPIGVHQIGDSSIVVLAGSDVASVPAEDALPPESYTHVQVTVTPAEAIPQAYRIYFNEDTARCLARPIVADLIAAMGGA